MTIPITINAFDPLNTTQSPSRALSGPVDSGAIVYDTDYGSNIYARWVYVGTSGDLSYQKFNGQSETLPNLAAGLWHPIPSIRINSTGTTIAANQLRWGS